MNTQHYLEYHIRECESKHRELTDLLAEFSKLDLHTKQTNGRFHYMIHYLHGRIYARTQERPLCRELAVKRDIEACIEDNRFDLAVLRALKRSLERRPYARKKLYENKGMKILLDEAYTLLRRNGTFFEEKEWQDMINGKLDERFFRVAGEEYRAIMQEEQARLYAGKKYGPAAQIQPGLPAGGKHHGPAAGNHHGPAAQTASAHSAAGNQIQIPENISPRLQKIRSHLVQTGADPRIQEWLDADYQRCPFRPENLIYPAYDGEKFRSKLEVHAAEILKRLSIAYRYEAALQIGNETYYPDFTLLHPRTFQPVYLEILGMMSDPDYERRAAKKLYVYTANGLVLGKNLLVYTETADEPLDFELMEKELEHLFLR